ncbi:MAG: 16S rRNA (adenine(1518)-N(6)/adenine(1519)-N(6))-dimethyltransferase RsmA [Oscillospiraceae bacterium]|jgi:16S rRNA (adenine1518-N6/adenine1519-N6)-dimethyltransferase|nr:16S rRNA (adenine(1518)-N(6)/adenine(1519)-N(6))-dimethyltransferase RsmA [Oscillospiraceae bacterium]
MLTDIYDPKALTATLMPLGFRFSKARGQSFLIDPAVPAAMARHLPPRARALEIGPGPGALTRALLQDAEAVVAIESDATLAAFLGGELEGESKLILLHADAVKTDLGALARQHSLAVACGNLPYAVTTPLLTALLRAGEYGVMLLMVQREVAQRLVSPPGSRVYGAFTVFARVYCESEILFTVPPESFFPRPLVTSAVIRLTRRPRPLVRDDDAARFFALVRAAFAHRRKTLANSLSASLGVCKETVAQQLRRAGIDPNARAETLDIPQFLAAAAQRATEGGDAG